MKNYDFTTLGGIAAATSELNGAFSAWSLDLDFHIRPEEGWTNIEIFSNYELIWEKRGTLEPASIAENIDAVLAWFDEYKLGVKRGMEQAVADLTADLEAVRAELAETKKIVANV